MGEALRVPVIWQCHLMKGGNRCLYSVTPFSEGLQVWQSQTCENFSNGRSYRKLALRTCSPTVWAGLPAYKPRQPLLCWRHARI